jgi:hypothetical protein
LINPAVLEDLNQLHAKFETAKPFRHVIIDDFLRSDVAEQMLRDFPTVDDPSKLVNEFGAPNPKSQISDVKSLSSIYVEVDDYIQSPEFLRAMEVITGIPDLRYDPWYYGAGTHENFHGAGLDAHYDFNIHPRTAYHRRLNAIVYLNKDWDPSWKGDIAFHTDPWDLKNDVKTSVTPEFNRCVVFETTENSWHSVTPVDLPDDDRGNSRKSFTIYLYTESRPVNETAPEHGTVYVQSKLSDHITEGRTLTAQDMTEIEENLHRRHEYLRNMYKREYRFSKIIDDLKRQVNEWKSTSYLPVLGLAKIKRVAFALYHDGWMSREVRADVELRADTRAITANVWLPDDQPAVEISVRFGGASTTAVASGGVTSIRLEVQGKTGEIHELALAADLVRVAGPDDAREISVIVDSLVFER